MRDAGVLGILIYCSDYKCSHSIAISADQWPDHIRLSELEARFVCKACGKRGADIRPSDEGCSGLHHKVARNRAAPGMDGRRRGADHAFDRWWEWAEKPPDSPLLINDVSITR